MFEIFEHTADAGIRVRAATLEQLFADAARGLFSIVVANPEAIRPLQEEAFTIAGVRDDDLLLDWLGELLYVFATRRILFSQFEAKRTTDGIDARARGEPLDPNRHHLNVEVKAVTYHGLKVERRDQQWLAEVIVDI